MGRYGVLLSKHRLHVAASHNHPVRVQSKPSMANPLTMGFYCRFMSCKLEVSEGNKNEDSFQGLD